jgi:type III restriction enzyme
MGELDVIDKLIINNPHREPQLHWKYYPESKKFSKEQGRRSAGYIIASERARSYDDPGRFIELPIVNQIRTRVDKWRNDGYPNATSVSRRLLSYWKDRDDGHLRKFFFCQVEAIETLIWLVEAPPSYKTGIDIPNDGGDFRRYCSKMATGTGKTVVMSMVCAWQILNKVSQPRDDRFSKNILIVAPGLTVRSRLQVLKPTNQTNYYQEFGIVPPGMVNLMNQGRVEVINWHALQWDSEEKIAKKKSVDKRGALSDEAYVREVLGDLASVKNMVVINDEAHHAWRVPAEIKEKKPKGVDKHELEEATKWVGGLDRINKVRGILTCFDFSATPFAPTGKTTSEEALFGWIVSDFGLNDAIESGLVKTPRVVVRDDGVHDPKTYKSKFYHIYDQISEDINRPAEEHEGLHDLLRVAYNILGYDWRETFNEWQKAGMAVPPAMISVVNRTETAARIKYAFDHKNIMIEELCDSEKTLRIDSKVLQKTDETDVLSSNLGELVKAGESLSKKDAESYLRLQVDTVGQVGQPGQDIRHVISVGMLSEGWDAKTVTHIMGLRAFTSQLLCEQVVGRGLRRTSYELNEDGLLDAEYVNVFGVPFSFLPHEGGGMGSGGRPTPPKVRIEPNPNQIAYEISFPNLIRIDHRLDYNLSLNIESLEELEIKASDFPTEVELAPIIDGKPDYSKLSEIDIKEIASSLRLQTIIFRCANNLMPYIEQEQKLKGGRHQLFGDLVKIIERVLKSDRVRINPKVINDDSAQRNLYLRLNMDKIIRHVSRALINENAQGYDLLYDPNEPIRYTRDAAVWYTSKECQTFKKSHINFCVFDSTWEARTAKKLDKAKSVEAWVKNDHIGFEIAYLYKGAVRKYIPDFIVRFSSGHHLILEVKGVEKDKDKEKWAYLDEWCRAVNSVHKHGTWSWDVSKDPSDIEDILAKHFKQ